MKIYKTNTYEVTVRAVVLQTFKVEAANFEEAKYEAEQGFDLTKRPRNTDIQHVDLHNIQKVSYE